MKSKEVKLSYWRNKYYECNTERLGLLDKVMDLEYDYDRLKTVNNHLLESSFIKTFTMRTPDGQWQRPIYEADIIVGLKDKDNA